MTDIRTRERIIRADARLPTEVHHVLMPAFVNNNNMPADQPMRRVVAERWNVAWSFKVGHVRELRLYEKPQATAPETDQPSVKIALNDLRLLFQATGIRLTGMVSGTPDVGVPRTVSVA
jgi:hypothetical protein